MGQNSLTSMIKCCLNKSVIIALALVGAGIGVWRPELLAPALPLLILAICPLSMGVMLYFMHKGMQGKNPSLESSAQNKEKAQ